MKQQDMLDRLDMLEAALAKINDTGDVGEAKRKTWEAVRRLDEGYGGTGSLFRAGSRSVFLFVAVGSVSHVLVYLF